MLPDQKSTLADLKQLIIKRGYIVIGTTILFSAAALVVGLVSPKVYQAEAIVTLPETSKNRINTDSKGNVKALINVLETKNLVGLYWKQRKDGAGDSTGSSLSPYVKSLIIEEIRGSTVQFRMLVYVEKIPDSGLTAIETVMNHLRNNEYVRLKYESERVNLMTALNGLQRSIDSSIAIREKVLRQLQGKTIIGFNPVEMESKLSDLRLKYYEMQIDLALFHSFEYVTPPYVTGKPVKPRILFNTSIAGMAGLFLSFMLVLLADPHLRNELYQQFVDGSSPMSVGDFR
ncbi:hypothetical protein HY768_04140 [candidate division TA06 bacterium]|uniref:Polysaccharide chain length determinant N-terminal domain-containing protein n=1 Tax=candidate division TA06 bacterium TaxID=2250710 RepID=A0A933MHT4_UNCT6|nr:hypothetical protein [candidate division TA06 bacterium]